MPFINCGICLVYLLHMHACVALWQSLSLMFISLCVALRAVPEGKYYLKQFMQFHLITSHCSKVQTCAAINVKQTLGQLYVIRVIICHSSHYMSLGSLCSPGTAFDCVGQSRQIDFNKFAFQKRPEHCSDIKPNHLNIDLIAIKSNPSYH